MSRGLGKFQEWVLYHTYLKTIKFELPPNWKRPRVYFQNIKEKSGSLNIYKRDWGMSFFKSEILLNYYDLILSDRYSWSRFSEKFKMCKQYRTALCNIARAIRRLSEEGYLEVLICDFDKSAYRITNKGINKIEDK